MNGLKTFSVKVYKRAAKRISWMWRGRVCRCRVSLRGFVAVMRKWGGGRGKGSSIFVCGEGRGV